MNVFEAVKQSVSTRQAAEFYGLHISRSGMAVCPFHNDKNPSMKVDKHFHCFGCGEDGDVIDFTAKLYGLGLKEAAVKLAEDFSVAYDSRGRASPKEPIRIKLERIHRYGQEERECYRILCDYLHSLYEWKEIYAPKPENTEWNPLFVEALEKTDYVEYLADMLLYGEKEEKKKIIKELGKEVRELEKRLSELNAKQGKSITDIREYRTGRECGRGKGYAGMER